MTISHKKNPERLREREEAISRCCMPHILIGRSSVRKMNGADPDFGRSKHTQEEKKHFYHGLFFLFPQRERTEFRSSQREKKLSQFFFFFLSDAKALLCLSHITLCFLAKSIVPPFREGIQDRSTPREKEDSQGGRERAPSLRGRVPRSAYVSGERKLSEPTPKGKEGRGERRKDTQQFATRRRQPAIRGQQT